MPLMPTMPDVIGGGKGSETCNGGILCSRRSHRERRGPARMSLMQTFCGKFSDVHWSYNPGAKHLLSSRLWRMVRQSWR